MPNLYKSLPFKIDLHSHSTCSDGTDTPTDLLNQASKMGIDIFALTDHDTIEGLDEATEQAKNLGIQLISGVEISCQYALMGGYGKHKAKEKIIHVVGLDFNDHAKMAQTLAKLQDSRASRGQNIVKKLTQLLDLDEQMFWQNVLKKANDNPQAVGRAHIAQVLHDMHMVKNVQQAFDKYLADDKPAYVAIDALSLSQAIELIHDCGGYAILAHPTRYRLSATRTRRLITEFAEMGGDACELPANDEPLSTRQMIDRSLAQHQLKVSVGSDFHGQAMPWRKLGNVPKPTMGQIGIWECFRTAN